MSIGASASKCSATHFVHLVVTVQPFLAYPYCALLFSLLFAVVCILSSVVARRTLELFSRIRTVMTPHDTIFNRAVYVLLCLLYLLLLGHSQRRNRNCICSFVT